jgi:hypothetical protein
MSDSSENIDTSNLTKVNPPRVRKYGTRADVFAGYALMTSGKLTKDDIIEKNGVLVSRKASDTSKARMAERRAGKPAAEASLPAPVTVVETQVSLPAQTNPPPTQTNTPIDPPQKKGRGRPKKQLPSNTEPDNAKEKEKELKRELAALRKFKKELAGFNDAKETVLRDIASGVIPENR